jgi:fatty-acyl-CoA synthase
MILTGTAPTTYPWKAWTIAGLLRETAEAHGDRLALINPDGRQHRWSEVHALSRSIAKGLAASGVKSGDHIGLWIGNQPEFLVLWLAAAHVGAITIPVSTRFTPHELAFVLGDCDPRVLFWQHDFLGRDNVATLAESETAYKARSDQLRVCADEPRDASSMDLDSLVRSGAYMTDEALDEITESVAPDDPTVVIYTSGSTGFPKGSLHSHNILRNECAITEYLATDTDSVTLGHMPFFHVAGGFSALLPALITGSRIVLMPKWDPTQALELIQEHRVTVFGGIATHYIDLLSHPRLKEFDVSSLRSGWIGGAFTPRQVMMGARDRLGYLPLPSYGMTETTSVTTFPKPTDPDELILSGRGTPIADFEVVVLNPETRAEAKIDEPGEVCVRGHIVMLGYLGRPDATAEVIDNDGWFHTGDTGVIGADGYLSIVGRIKEMFTVGGNNVFPIEIEKHLNDHPDVQQAYVVPVPDDRLGDVAFAFVEVMPSAPLDAAALHEYCRASLTSYKVPREFIFVDTWPTVESGKINKRQLKADGESYAADRRVGR